MLGLNQCSFALTCNDPVIQYYKVCKTCSTEGEVKVCLNCASICHEGHNLGTLLRERFFCRCHETCPCRTYRSFESSSSSSATKKRKADDTTPTTGRKIAVWTQFMSNPRSILSLHSDIEEANEVVKSAFVTENPWRHAETSLKSRASFEGNIAKDTGLAHYSVICKENESWVVAADYMDSFVQSMETGGSSSSRHTLPSVSVDTEHSASVMKTKRAKITSSPPPVSHRREDDDLVIIDANNNTSAEKVRKPKAPRDPNAPKNPLSAYIYFSNDYREKIKADQSVKAEKNLPPSEMMKIVAEKWKTITEEEKEPFSELARIDKERFTREMDEYKATKQAQPTTPAHAPTEVVDVLESISATTGKKNYDASDSHSIEFKDGKSDDEVDDEDAEMDADPKPAKKLTLPIQHTATSSDDVQDETYVVWACYRSLNDQLHRNLIRTVKTKAEANAVARQHFYSSGKNFGLSLDSQSKGSTLTHHGMLTLRAGDGKRWEWIVSVVPQRDYQAPPMTQVDHDGNGDGEDEDQ